MNSSTLHHHVGRLSKKLLLAYTFDWLIIILFAAAGGALSFVSPVHQVFSLLNLEISHPYIEETITTWMLVVIALLCPAVLILAITIFLVPGSQVRKRLSRGQIWRLKAWELEKGLAGLCLSVAVAFFITQGMKNMFGKPRPSLLARCQPDLDVLAEHVVGGWGQDLSMRWTLVDSGICGTTDRKSLDDGFRSFPSGHASWSWSGLLYLTLFFCAKFAVGFPFLPPQHSRTAKKERLSWDQELLPLHANGATGDSQDRGQGQKYEDEMDDPLALRNAAAAPPNYLLIPALLPVGVAVYICSTRYHQYYHFGFDLLAGSLIGIVTAYVSFRWYHLPISRGQGWAWGSRSRDRAFWIGVGSAGYVGDEGWESRRGKRGDLEGK
ncbi:acid phosphatase Vanadium-dependent haloperoxidase [Lecanosticta acicola]|uniref:Acid phosphatase Vanadium-dependent haloperoxidase n=1 Tax=Lecanosticta acicola TaxID=111012 RepID=A0AAI9EA90_9PEZI|nr:acid phosphatase Vanadium-dependent haloperoxidase [Lecanosticta acicola]